MDKENIFLRERDVKNVTKIIEVLKNTKKPNTSISLAINSRNGNGKTYFIKYLVDFLPAQGDCKNKTLYYNAEEYDDCEDPILPLAYNIISKSDCEESASFLKYTKVFLTACGFAILKGGMGRFLDSKVSDIVSEGVNAIKDTELKNIFEEFDSFFKKREQLSNVIRDIIPVGGMLWVFIDELDKCKPEYAIKMLEIIKHYFDIPNVVFAVSIDLDMMICALKKIYGRSFDANSYLRHYFDYIYNPIEIDWERYINKKVYEYQLRNRLNNSNITFITNIFKNWFFSIREAEICLNSIIYFLNFYKELLKDQGTLTIYLYFLMLKFRYNLEYVKVLRGNYILEDTRGATFKKLDSALNIDPIINTVLKDLENGKAGDNTSDLIKKYNLFNIENVFSFSQNIEWVLNYSI